MTPSSPPRPLRSPDAVRARAGVLAALLARQADEAGAPSHPVVDVEEHLFGGMTPTEEELLRAARGSWDDAVVLDVSWSREALGALGWTLGWIDHMPAYDVGFGMEDVLLAFSTGYPRRDTAYARTEGAIRAARDLAEAWHWRIRTFVLEDELVAQGVDPPDVVRQVVEYQHEHAGVPIAGRDFRAFDKPFRDLDLAQFDTVLAVTLQRHLALNWVCGLAETWDDRASMTT